LSLGEIQFIIDQNLFPYFNRFINEKCMFKIIINEF
jgi:hypothetical protein